MAITISKTQLDSITKPDLNPSDTLTFIEGATDTITNIQCTIEDDPHVNIVIDLAELSITLSGYYIDPYKDFFYLLDPGKSAFPESQKFQKIYSGNSNIMEPLVFQGITGIPRGKDMYRVEQDTTPLYTKTFTATVTYTRYTSASKGTSDIGDLKEVFTFTQEVLNNSESIRLFLLNYFQEEEQQRGNP